MANNTYVNQVVYDGNTLIDLTTDTAVATDVLSGKYFHLASGQRVQGSCTYDSNTTDADATASEILYGKTAYVNTNKITGSMTNNGSNNVTVTSVSGASIPAGYYNGSGKAVLDSTSASNLTASNIRQGVTILGVEGELSPTSELTVGAATATPTSSQQVITAASLDYDYITQVTVYAIPYTETDNAQGGKTVVIGASA
ncbi:MAG: hypothetical protein J6S36_03685 [Eggerthellaceae bacterium]|nr:hypothetical protein [Eggerthellaceae bacterium]